MRLVLLLTAVGGAGLVVCELLGPGAVRRPRGRARRRRGGLRHRPRRLLRRSPRSGRWRSRHCAVCCAAPPASPCALMFALGAGALAVVAGPDVLLVAGAGFAVYYLAHGSTWPLLQRGPAHPGRRRAPGERGVGDVPGHGAGRHRRQPDDPAAGRGAGHRGGVRRRSPSSSSGCGDLPVAAAGHDPRGTGGRRRRAARCGLSVSKRAGHTFSPGSSPWRISSTATPSGRCGTRCSARSARARPAYAGLFASLQPIDGEELAARADLLSQTYRDAGVTFAYAGEEQPFPLDLVPRVIDADGVGVIERGVAQRVRALEALPRRRLRPRPGFRRPASSRAASSPPARTSTAGRSG